MVPFTFAYDWDLFEDENLRRNALAEFAACGVKHMVLTDGLIRMIGRLPKMNLKVREEAAEVGLDFVDSHAPFGNETDISIPVKEWRPQMIERMKFTLTMIRDFGVDSCCVHVNSTYYRDYTIAQHLDAARDSLEKLLPTAEDLGVTICLENIFKPANSVDDVLSLIKEFPSPALGACYDIGHANIMEHGKGNPECLAYSRYEGIGEIPWETDSLGKMLPYIVNCHLHDNNAALDTHTIPGLGTVDFKGIMPRLKTAPRLKNMQSEVIPVRRNHIPITTLVKSFESVMAL